VPAGASRREGFRLALDAAYPQGRPVTVTLLASFAGACSPVSRTAVLPTGQTAAAAPRSPPPARPSLLTTAVEAPGASASRASRRATPGTLRAVSLHLTGYEGG
jgi:hypothetical protein